MPEEQVLTLATPFSNENWSETAPVIEEKKEEPIIEKKEEGTPIIEKKEVVDDKEEVIDHKEWLKREFGVEDAELIKAEREELKKIKETPKEEFKYANSESEKMHKAILAGDKKIVRQILETQEKIETLVGGDVNESTAEDIIKLGLKLKHKDLTDAEINYKFNKTYSLPKEPQGDLEDEDFKEKHDAWKEQVEDIKMSRIIDAKTMKPELEKAKAELVLPDIPKVEIPQNQEPTQEELQKFEAIRNKYLTKLESDYKNFKGYEVKYKDEEVEVPVSYLIPEEENAALKEELKDFDVNDFIMKRWFDEKGEPNISQMMDDVTLLRKKESVFQKIANETGAQVLKHYRGIKGNVNVTGHQDTSNPNGGKSQMDEQIDFLWKQKY